MIALCYSGEFRDVGPGFYCRVAMKKLGIPHKWYWPQLGIPQGHEFYLSIDDGRDEVKVVPPRPNGFWAIDTHLGYEARLEKARHFDQVWCAQKAGAERMKSDGVNAEWLPLACSPDHHPSVWEAGYGSARYDVAFVGHLQPPGETDRIAFLDTVFKAVPNFRFEFGVFHQEMAKVYHHARVGLNHSLRRDLNMRFFELASIGVSQLCGEMDGLDELGFVAGVDYQLYRDAHEAVEKIRADKKTLSFVAHQKVRAEHTYEHRVRRMLAGH